MISSLENSYSWGIWHIFPENGEPSGNLAVSLQEKVCFSDFQGRFWKLLDSIRLGYWVWRPGNLGEPSSSPKSALLDLGDLTRFKSFNSLPSRRAQNVENSKHEVNVTIPRWFDYAIISIPHWPEHTRFLIIWDCGELFGHRRLPHLSTFSRTFWMFSEKLKTKIEILSRSRRGEFFFKKKSPYSNYDFSKLRRSCEPRFWQLSELWKCFLFFAKSYVDFSILVLFKLELSASQN